MSIKVLHVPYGGLGSGGVGKVILSITERLRQRFDFGCVVFNRRGSKEELFQTYGKLHRIKAYPENGKMNIGELLLRPFRMYFGIRKICRTEKYDVIHCHNGDEEGICLLAAKHAGVPKRIAHSHNTPSPQKIGLKRFRAFTNRRLVNYAATDKVCCSSAAGYSYYGMNDYRVIVNSVDFERFNAGRRKPHSGTNYIHVGRFTYQKNQEFVLSVFAEILLLRPQSKLYLVGYGEDEDMLKRIIRERNLGEAVEMIPGDGADVAAYYAMADYMIFPSRFEGFGIVLLEAQAMGLRCFVSEAIQKEADAGLLTYISLNESAQQWARTITDYADKAPIPDKKTIDLQMQKYREEAVAEQYAALYGERK